MLEVLGKWGQAIFSTSNSPFPEGKGGRRTAACLEGSPRPVRACGTVLQPAEVGELARTPALQSCPPSAASPRDFLQHRAVLRFCGSSLRYPSSLRRGSILLVPGCVPLLFPCSWARILWPSFPGSPHHTAHPFDRCCCSTLATEPPGRV